MKKRLYTLGLVVLLVLGLCGHTPIRAAEISINVNKKTLYAGTFYQLKLKNANGDIIWKSSKESVAKVYSDGMVIALKKGKTTITAQYNGTKYACSITVKNPSINKAEVSMRVDDNFRLKMKGANPVSWLSSNTKVATVDDGGLVKALMVGTTKITVKCENGNEYTSTVNVKNYNLKVGDIVKMGHYEQDNNTVNGAELIEWEVLDVQDGKALLLSRYALDNKRFCAEKYNRQTWDVCEIRTWLNNTFYDNAFDKEEKEKIILSPVSADLNPKDDGKSQGTGTNDNVFLLSIKEVEKYEPSKCMVSEYAISQGIVSSEGYCNYFLRTTGWCWQGVYNDFTIISAVKTDGTVFYALYPDYEIDGYDFRGEYKSGIRPAMWIRVD